MPKVQNKVRKGDAVAIKATHSAHDVNFKRSEWTTWLLATVAEASREGVARRVILAGQSHSVRLGPDFELYAIGADRQAAAKRAVSEMAYPGREFATSDDIKNAIREA